MKTKLSEQTSLKVKKAKKFKPQSKYLTAGYSDVKKRVEKGSHFVKSCTNCGFFSEEDGDEEELCQNASVLKYDMVVEEDCSRIYCLRWCPVGQENKQKEEW